MLGFAFREQVDTELIILGIHGQPFVSLIDSARSNGGPVTGYGVVTPQFDHDLLQIR
jgi:hypothetical protein